MKRVDNWLDALIEKYDINPEAIIEIGDGWVSIDCSKTGAEEPMINMLKHY